MDNSISCYEMNILSLLGKLFRKINVQSNFIELYYWLYYRILDKPESNNYFSTFSNIFKRNEIINQTMIKEIKKQLMKMFFKNKLM